MVLNPAVGPVVSSRVIRIRTPSQDSSLRRAEVLLNQRASKLEEAGKNVQEPRTVAPDISVTAQGPAGRVGCAPASLALSQKHPSRILKESAPDPC